MNGNVWDPPTVAWWWWRGGQRPLAGWLVRLARRSADGRPANWSSHRARRPTGRPTDRIAAGRPGWSVGSAKWLASDPSVGMVDQPIGGSAGRPAGPPAQPTGWLAGNMGGHTVGQRVDRVVATRRARSATRWLGTATGRPGRRQTGRHRARPDGRPTG